MQPRADFSRRQLLRYSAASLLMASVWPGSLFADDVASGDFNFIEINDLHYTDDKCGPYFEKLVQQMNATSVPVDFVILAGDLTENGKLEQFKPQKEILAKIKFPLHVVIGNHDWVSKTDRKPYEQAWPGSYNYTFENKGWQFIGLDTSEGTSADVTCQKPTFDWLDENLPRLSKDKPTIVFTHFPLGIGVKYRVKNADDLLSRFKEYNLQACLNGHYHGFTERTIGKVVCTTNRCCSFRRNNHDNTKEKGYFLCSAKAGQVSRSFVEFKFA